MFKGKNFTFKTGEKTYIMGILNVTDDSFFDGGKYNTKEKALQHTVRMLNDGADIIDIGAQSTRPGHKSISADEELKIIREYLPYIYDNTKAVISVDTFYPEVAEYALENGASIINDVRGCINPKMADLVKKYNCGWIIMHNGGGNSDTVSEYSQGVLKDINSFFKMSVEKCLELGILKEQLMLDVGIGFGKTFEQNLEILKYLDKIEKYDCDLMVAASNKRVVGEATDTDGDDRICGTIALNTLAVKNGADFVRVHNVKENVVAMKMADALVRR